MASQPPPDSQEQHKAAQDALALSLALILRRLWDALFGTGAPTPDTLPIFKAQATAVVTQGALAAQKIAQEFYDASRSAAGVAGSVRPALVAVPTPALVGAAIDKALEGLSPAVDSDVLPSDVVANALTNVTSAMELAVVDSGRDLIFETTTKDRYAVGWARVPKPGACSFCMMMATRGAIYKTAESAGRVDASTIWPDASGAANRYHPGCRCQVVPIFRRGTYEPPKHVQDATDLYFDVTADYRGHGKAKAFRRAYERGTTGPGRASRPKDKRPLTFTSLTPDELQHQLNVLVSMPDSDYKTRQLARIRGRLTELARSAA